MPSFTYTFHSPSAEEKAKAEGEQMARAVERRKIEAERDRLVSVLMTIAHDDQADYSDRIAAADLLLDDIRRRLDEE